jgi:rare lipoprotein A (peptidoglycan hydrolase)
MLKLAIGLTPAALMLSVAIVVLMTIGGFACSPARVSWYGHESCISSPCRTRSGELFTGRDLTAAMADPRHIGEHWRATSLDTGRSVTVRVNDTGNMGKYGRALDLSKAAFLRIAPLKVGVISVCLERISE